MKKYLFLIIVLLILASVSAVFAQVVPPPPPPPPVVEEPGVQGTQSAPPPPPEPNICAILQDTPILEALESLFKNLKLQYAIDPEITGSVTIKLEDVKLTEALDTLGKMAGFTYARENGVWTLKKMPLPFLTENDRVRVLPKVGTGTPEPPSTSATLGTSSNGYIRYGSGGYTSNYGGGMGGIGSTSGYNVSPENKGHCDIAQIPNNTGVKTFDITLDQANLFDALKQLMDVSGDNYILDTGATSSMPQFQMWQPKITAKMKGVSLDTALSLLTKSVNLTVQNEKGVYIIGVQGYGSSGYGGMGSYGGMSGSMMGGYGGVTSQLCTKCKKPMPPDAKFCPQCGAKVILPKTPAPPKTPAKSTSAKPAAAQGGT